MSTPTHVSDGLGLLPCRTASQANRSTCAATSPPSRTVPDRPGYTFGYIPANNYRGPKPSVEDRCPPSQLVVMRWLHICRSTKSRRVWWSPTTLPVADERASFRPLGRRRPSPTNRSLYADEGTSPACIESRACEQSTVLAPTSDAVDLPGCTPSAPTS